MNFGGHYSVSTVFITVFLHNGKYSFSLNYMEIIKQVEYIITYMYVKI